MKLSSKLPTRNGIVESRLPADLIASPNSSRLLIVEVSCSKLETTFDEYGDEILTPTAEVLSAEYITDLGDIAKCRMVARRAFDRRRGHDTLPGVDVVTGELVDDEADR